MLIKSKKKVWIDQIHYHYWRMLRLRNFDLFIQTLVQQLWIPKVSPIHHYISYFIFQINTFCTIIQVNLIMPQRISNEIFFLQLQKCSQCVQQIKKCLHCKYKHLIIYFRKQSAVMTWKSKNIRGYRQR